MNVEGQMGTIEAFLDEYVYAYDTYTNSQTCDSSRYMQQYEEMTTKRRVLLEFIRNQIDI